jgi:hypothetical protein
MKWIKVVGPTVLSGTTSQKVSGANFKLPADAKCLLAIIPHCSSPAGLTAGEAVMASVELKSDSNPVTPYKVLTAPIGSTLGKSGFSPQDPAPIYPVNCPVKGGSEIEVWATGLIDHTIEPYVTVELVLSDFLASPQFKAKIGTLTTMGSTSAGETKGSGIRLEGAHRIIEAAGYAVGTTVATLKGICGKFRLSSSGFKGMGDVELAIENIGGAIATDATTASVAEFAHLTRRKDLDIPVTDPIDIDDYFNLGVALTTAGKFVVGVLYN